MEVYWCNVFMGDVNGIYRTVNVRIQCFRNHHIAHDLSIFLHVMFSEHCYYQRVSARHPGTGCSRLPHTVALVSFPPSAESRTGLAFTVDECPLNGNSTIIKISQ